MDTRQKKIEIDQNLKENGIHVRSMVTNPLSVDQNNGIQIISTTKLDKEQLLVGTTTHGEDVIYVDNTATLEKIV